MSEKNNGGAAFPLYGVSSVVQHGMDLRDYFAAQAMPQVYASSAVEFARSRMTGEEYAARVAVGAYVIADAMLAERAK